MYAIGVTIPKIVNQIVLNIFNLVCVLMIISTED